jgi:hypothetical protein
MRLPRPFRILAAVCGLSFALSAAPAVGATSPPAPAPGCSAVGARAQQRLMDGYRDAGTYPARQTGTTRGVPGSVTVQVPRIAFTGPGTSSNLPVGPCQTIYRFAFPRVQARDGDPASPFRYVEVDWNTEGLPRGPNDSFSSPHFDFHYYMRPRAWVDDNTMCVSTNGRTCDETRTTYRQMRRFLQLPPAGLVPPAYFADTGSSIPLMGLHLLDGLFHYTVDSVDHHPTLIYGTFGGRVLFAESSVTLDTLQDAIRAPGHTLSFPFRQPHRVQDGVAWPTRFTITYDPATQGFTAGFTRFRAHAR